MTFKKHEKTPSGSLKDRGGLVANVIVVGGFAVAALIAVNWVSTAFAGQSSDMASCMGSSSNYTASNPGVTEDCSDGDGAAIARALNANSTSWKSNFGDDDADLYPLPDPAATEITTAGVSTAGVAIEGNIMHATTTEWQPSDVKISYQWLRNGVPISGATGSSYTLTNADRNRTISVRVTGAKLGLDSKNVTSTGKVVKPKKTKVVGSSPY